MDETLSNGTSIVAQPVTYYDSTLQLAYTATPFPGWMSTDSMSLRKSLPQEKWTLTTPTYINQNPAYGPLGPVITLPAGASQQDNYYNGRYVYFASNGPSTTLTVSMPVFSPVYGTFLVKSYKSATRELFVDYDLSSSSPLPNTVVNQGTFLPGSTASLWLLSNLTAPTASSSYYVGYTITNTTQMTTATIGLFNYGIQGTDTVYTTQSTSNPFGTAPNPGDSYIITSNAVVNIVSIQNNNAVSLDYIGSMVSVNQAICYTVELIELILPNSPLEDGTQIAFYPYVYVELKNVSAPTSASSATLYSNNPPSGRALFVVTITDITQPSTSTFVKLSCSEKNKIKFKPNDSLRFSVTLPDGTPVTPSRRDTSTPYAPDPTLQIHAMFGLTPR